MQAIRAIPIAPLLDDYVAPIVDPLFRARDEEGEAEREAGAAGETDDPSVGASDED